MKRPYRLSDMAIVYGFHNDWKMRYKNTMRMNMIETCIMPQINLIKQSASLTAGLISNTRQMTDGGTPARTKA